MKHIFLTITLLLSVVITAQQEELLFDDFNGKTDYDWTSGRTNEHYKSIKKGLFHVINKSPSKITWNSVKVPLDEKRNFSIETNVALFQKNEGEAFLIFGENKQTTEFHFVKIRDVEKKYSVQFGTFSGGKWKGNWINVDINPLKKFNRLTVKKVGDNILLLVNGIIVAKETYKPFFGNTIGLGSGGPQHSVFDYIMVIQQ